MSQPLDPDLRRPLRPGCGIRAVKNVDRLRWKYGLLAACLGSLTGGCASYEAQPVPTATPLIFVTRVDQVTMEVEPLSGGQVKMLFDTNPVEIRILFVRALLHNDGEEEYLVSRSSMRLVTKQGIALMPVSPSRVARKVRQGYDGRAVVSLYMFGPLSYPSFLSANEASEAMVKDLTDKGFPEQGALTPHVAVGGVLYFELPSYVSSHDGVRMDMALRPRSAGRSLQIQIPIVTESAKGEG